MQAVVELALEGPGELRVLDVAGVELEAVRVHAERALLEFNGNLDSLALDPSAELEQGVLVLGQLGLHSG